MGIRAVQAYFISPPVVTDGLVFYVNAADTISYSGGSSWRDLTTPGRSATLVNTPSYTTSYGGTLRFIDTSNQYATAPDIGDLNTWTVDVWFNLSTALTDKVTTLVTNQFDLSTKLNFSIGTNNSPASYNLCVGFFDGSWRNTVGFVPDINTWYQVIGSYDGNTVRQYVNGLEIEGSLSYSGTPQSGGEIRFMRRWDEVVTTNNLCAGDLYGVKIYNRALSNQEVLQNYNAHKARFGLL